MSTAMRFALLVGAAVACLSAPGSALAALPAPEQGVMGADGTFRKTGTEVGKAAQAVNVVGSYRIKDDEVFGAEYCPQTGFSQIQSLLPGFTAGGSVVQYNWASKAVPSVQLVNKSWKCGGEVRVELELRAQVKRDLFDWCRRSFGIVIPCNFRTSSGCETKVLQFCNINVYGELRLYEGTSANTTNLRRSTKIDTTLVPWGGRYVNDNIELVAKAGDYVKMKLLITTNPTFILQG